jgi:ABC-type multidrug transport system fused ATPase/permease subunit
LKSGAARIALGAVSAAEGGALDLKIVPAGLYYTAKTTFRSEALLYFGEPLKIEPVALDEDGEPPREAVAAVSQEIEHALREVVLNAEHEEALNTIARAERIFSAEQQETDAGPNLKREFELRRRFIEGYASLRASAPERLSALTSRITRYEEELDQVGIDPRDLTVPDSPGAAVRRAVRRTVPSLLLLPFAVVGTLIHYPAYKLAGFFAHKFSGSYDDVISTIKILAATLLFPLTWAGVAVLCYLLLHDWKYALAALLFVPLAGYAAVRFYEELDRFIAGARALLFFITRRWFFKKLLVERRAIHEEILLLGSEALSEGGN